MSVKVFLTAFFVLLSVISKADPSQSTPPNLAQALAAAQPPADGMVLAVGAESISLPADTETPDSTATPAQIAQAYGGITQIFGVVTAVAPQAVPALNPNPHDPNIFDGMTPEQVLSLLTSSLDNSQWQALPVNKAWDCLN